MKAKIYFRGLRSTLPSLSQFLKSNFVLGRKLTNPFASIKISIGEKICKCACVSMWVKTELSILNKYFCPYHTFPSIHLAMRNNIQSILVG